MDDYVLCLDEVDGAGAFLEVEAVAAGTDGMGRMQAQLARWGASLGAPLERTGATYDQLVQEPAPAG